MQYVQMFLLAAWQVLEEMAPYLLLGFLAAGSLHVLVKRGLIERLLGGGGVWAVTKAALVGVPMPVCSCGVIPLAASLRSKGASKGATTSFLISTPETGVDSILATYALLGPIFTVYRVLVAFFTGVGAGLMVSLFDRETSPDESVEAPPASCCCESTESSCCEAEAPAPTPWSRVKEGLRFGFVTLPRDIARPLLVGILIAAGIAILVEQQGLREYLDKGMLTMLLMMVIGIPLYVCSTASIPIAVGFLHAGISPGAALVFLIVGPATNAATMGVVWKMLGRRTLVVYLASIAVLALIAGVSLDYLYAFLGTSPALPDFGHDHGVGHWLKIAAATALLILLAVNLVPPSLWKRAPENGGDSTEVDTCCSE